MLQPPCGDCYGQYSYARNSRLHFPAPLPRPFVKTAPDILFSLPLLPFYLITAVIFLCRACFPAGVYFQCFGTADVCFPYPLPFVDKQNRSFAFCGLRAFLLPGRRFSRLWDSRSLPVFRPGSFCRIGFGRLFPSGCCSQSR